MSGRAIKDLTRHSSLFFSGTALSRVTGLLRDFVTAWTFGADASVAAFLAAFRLSHLLRRLFGEGALHGAFIPQYELLRNKSPDIAARFFIASMSALALFLTFLIALITLSILALNHFGLLDLAADELLYLSLILLPGLPFICLYALSCAFLQVHHRFFLTGLAPALLNLGWIAGVILLHDLQAKQAMPYLALFVVFATASQWLLLLPSIYKVLSEVLQRWHYSYLSPFYVELKLITKPFFFGMAGVAATQINSALDLIFARAADLSGPAYLWYAIRLQQLPLALFGISLAAALLPKVSSFAASGDMSSYRTSLKTAISYTLAFSLPLTVLLLIGGRLMIGLLYGHGSFEEEALWQTTYCLWGYALGLIPMALVIITVPARQALGDYKSPMCASVAAVIANLLLNTIFVFFMGWGCASVAIATSLSSWLQLALISLSYYVRKSDQKERKELKKARV